jgi:hypothetical protein
LLAKFAELDRTREHVATTKVERAKREICVSDQLFGLEIPGKAHNDVVPRRKYGIVCVSYLATIGIAMIGWLWLIAWCMLQIV